MRQRTQLINALRAHLAELGVAAAQGREGIKELLAIVAQGGDTRLPVDAHASLMVLAAQLQAVQTMIGSIEKRIVSQHRSNKESKRLQTIPGIGVIGATAIAAAAAKLLSDDDLLGSVNAVNLKHVLGDIQTDGGDLHVGSSLM